MNTKANSVGLPILPREDLRFISGLGNYIDDISLKSMAHCAFLRSPYAHAKIISIDSSKLLYRNPDVIGVFTASDIDPITSPIKVDIPFPGIKPMFYHYLAKEKVRWVGDAVVAVVARDRYAAEDALEEINVSYEEILPAVIDPEAALKPSSQLLYEDWGTNRFLNATFSNRDESAKNISHSESDDNDELTIEERIVVHRYCGVPIETRGCIASYNYGARDLTCWTPTQAPHVHKSLMAGALRLPENRVRVIAADLGGGFGVKLNTYPEDVIVAVLSMLLRRPIKWIETRQEHFLATGHSRDQIHYAKMIVSKDNGTIKSLSDRMISDVGAFTYFPHNVFGTLMVTSSMLPGPYRIQNYQYEIDWVVTNKTPFGAYRGFGQPEATFVMERLMDIAARKLGLDPVEFRRKNILKSDDLPYTNPTGTVFDSGSYLESLNRAAEIIGYEDFKTQRAEARGKGRYLGIGFACNAETTVPTIYGATRRWTAHDSVTVRIEPDGEITILAGLASIGTSIDTALRQIAADEFQEAPEKITVVIGDTDSTPYSSGLYGSRSAVVCGASVIFASKRIIRKMRMVAAHLLEARESDVALESGGFKVKGSPGRPITRKEIARVCYDESFRLPPGIEAGLEETYFYEPPNIQNFPDKDGKINVSGTTTNATHAAIVEADPESGKLTILKYVIVHDCGRIINPLVVDAQVHGGLMQSIGGTIFEEIAYDDMGQPMTSSFIDYLIPTSMELPSWIKTEHLVSPSPFVEGGFKGAGEAGTIGVPAAIANALEDALEPFGVKIVSTPLDPNRIWRLMKRQTILENKGKTPPRVLD